MKFKRLIAALLVALFIPALSWAADSTYQAKVYSKPGGNELVVASGGVITVEDGGTITLEPGAVFSASGGDTLTALTVRAGTNLGAGDLVYLSSWHAADAAFIASLADADVAAADAQYVATGTIASGATGGVQRAATITMDTQGSTVGDPVYLTITGTTTNTMSLSAPTGVDDRVQIIGRVMSVAAGGTVKVNVGALPTTIVTAAQIRDESIATADILDGTILNADVGAAAAIARSKLAEDALQIYGVPIAALRSDAGAGLLAAETGGTFDVTVGTNTILANAEVTDNETETSIAYFQFVLPAEYVAAGDVTIRLPVALIATAAAVNNGSTVDVAVYEQSDAGAVGSDLSTTTSAATFAALDTWYNKDFVITASGLVAGDVMNVKITSVVVDSEAGGGTLVLNLAPPKVLLDIKG